MSEIKRYDPDARHLESGTYVGFLTECADGEAVLYDDHAAAMAAKDARLTALYRAASALIDMIDADADLHRLDETHAYRELCKELERSE